MRESPDIPAGRPERGSAGSGHGDAAAPAAGTDRVDPDDEVVDEFGEESFPASDSPSSWAGPPSESR